MCRSAQEVIEEENEESDQYELDSVIEDNCKPWFEKI
jgi:hypothetical protein